MLTEHHLQPNNVLKITLSLSLLFHLLILLCPFKIDKTLAEIRKDIELFINIENIEPVPFSPNINNISTLITADIYSINNAKRQVIQNQPETVVYKQFDRVEKIVVNKEQCKIDETIKHTVVMNYNHNVSRSVMTLMPEPHTSKNVEQCKGGVNIDNQHVMLDVPDVSQLLQTDAGKNYLAFIKQRIENNKRYPKEARENNEEGVTELVVTIRDGYIENTVIKSSSGYDLLDKSAIETVTRVAPFHPVPHILKHIKLSFKIAIRYELE
ncbi:MAG: energy transducer TonB [Candidatus Hydrogenedentota bacterium]